MRLIDADALSEEFKGYPYGYRGMVLQVVADTPTIDPVKHGRWKRTPTGWVYCSVCGQEPPNETNIETNYCPHCGAKMDEVSE